MDLDLEINFFNQNSIFVEKIIRRIMFYRI